MPSKRDRIEKVIQASEPEAKPDWSKQIVRFIERDDSLTPNYRVLQETTVAQMLEDFKLVGDPKYQNRFLPKDNCFAASHNKEIVAKRTKRKAAKASEDATGDDSRPSADGKGIGIPEAATTFAGRTPRIIGGAKRSIWGGRERSAVRAWDK